MGKLTLSFLLLLIGLSGCASNYSGGFSSLLTCLTGCPAYGNFATNASIANSNRIARDVADRLALLYLPASTRFNICQETTDAFGNALVRVLRDKGYAVFEFHPEAESQVCKKSSSKAINKAVDLDLRYVFDRPDNTNFYRVMVKVGGQLLIRAYVEQGTTVLPVGAWVRREE